MTGTRGYGRVEISASAAADAAAAAEVGACLGCSVSGACDHLCHKSVSRAETESESERERESRLAPGPV